MCIRIILPKAENCNIKLQGLSATSYVTEQPCVSACAWVERNLNNHQIRTRDLKYRTGACSKILRAENKICGTDGRGETKALCAWNSRIGCWRSESSDFSRKASRDNRYAPRQRIRAPCANARERDPSAARFEICLRLLARFEIHGAAPMANNFKGQEFSLVGANNADA